MNTWNKLFDILQVLNPQSDEDIIRKDEGRWDDICHYMAVLQEDSVDADEGISDMIRLLREIYDDKLGDSGDRGNSLCMKIDKELMKYGIDLTEEAIDFTDIKEDE